MDGREVVRFFSEKQVEEYFASRVEDASYGDARRWFNGWCADYKAICGKYVSGSMSSTANVDDWGENVQLDRVLQETFVKPYFELNADEIEKEISKRAEYHRKRIAELSAELEIVDDVAKRYAKAIASAIEEVETAIGRTSANLIINKINSWNYKWMAKED